MGGVLEVVIPAPMPSICPWRDGDSMGVVDLAPDDEDIENAAADEDEDDNVVRFELLETFISTTTIT
jgi:hypothetical protein